MKHARAMFLLLATASISYAQPVVTNNLDGFPAPNGSLRWAISTAAPGDTITFSLAVNDSLIVLSEGELVVDKNLGFDGSGSNSVTVSGDNTSRVLRADHVDVYVRAVDFIDGDATGLDGGCMLQDGGTLKLYDVDFVGCTARRGGGLFADTSNVYMSGDDQSRVQVTGNSALHGGGIYSVATTFDLVRTTVSANTADSLGGGIRAVGHFDLSSSEVSNNTSVKGGGLALEGGPHFLEDSKIDHNVSSFWGGGIYQLNADVDLDNTDVLENKSFIGGGFYVDGGTVDTWLSTIARDSALTSGGGIFARNSADVAIRVSTMDRNYALQSGGAAYATNSRLGGITAHFTKNHASTGGAIYGTAGAIVSLWVSDVTENAADLADSGLKNGGGIYMTNTSDSLYVRDTNISFNAAPAGRGGGIFNASSKARIFEGSNITVNSADGFSGAGGGIHNQGTLVIADSRIAGNMADDTISDSEGAGILNQGHLTITSSTVNSNLAKGDGGGIVNNDTLIVINSTISSNISKDGDGGGIWNWGVLTIQNSTLTLNEAEQTGGGFYDVSVSDGPISLYSTIVAGNTATTYPDIRINNAGHSITSGGFNLVGDGAGANGLTHGVNDDQVGSSGSLINPLVAALELNGGYTRTHALLVGSPAIDQGDCSSTALSEDQRGEIRPVDDAGASNAGDGCDVGSFEFDGSSAVTVDITIMLEGPYSTASDDMSTTINSDIPLAQPFSDVSFVGTTLEYAGAEALGAVPGTAVDWVLVQLRSGDPGAPPMNVVGTRAAIALSDGSIVDVNGSSDVTFSGSMDGNYYIAVFGRNHLGIMTADSMAVSGATSSYDFTTASAQAYGLAPMKELEAGVYGLFAGDGNADGQVTAPDFNLWNAATTAGATGYQASDYNMDGIVTAPDFNLWNANTTAGASSKVPE